MAASQPLFTLGDCFMTLGSHQSTIGKSQTHITPKWLIDRLGPFDLDPCAADPRPWDCAKINYTEDGLEKSWDGFVWLNPPFNRYEVGEWIERLAFHGHGIALLHARTEAGWFEPVWEFAASILFMADRIKFCRPDGTEQPANSGAPPCLIAFGTKAATRLHDSGIRGALVTQWHWDWHAAAIAKCRRAA
jgi:DNA N-6-adenine-methyltransferase Dam